jgi:plastocyanin
MLRPRSILCVLLLAPPGAGPRAAELLIEVEGRPDRVVASLHSESAAQASQPRQAVMDQRNRHFEPDLLVVTVGSSVSFPNSDNIRHHVYSFSPARRFELALYSGTPSIPIEFPHPGIVSLGCNIHDWMAAHIVVLDTPFHAVSQTSEPLRLEAPAGDYLLRLWHPRLGLDGGVAAPLERSVQLSEDAALTLRLQMPLRPPGPPPLSDDARLRELQQRFRALRKEP